MLDGFLMGYIDPGGGSIILQILLGSMIGFGIYFRQGIHRLLRLFRRNS